MRTSHSTFYWRQLGFLAGSYPGFCIIKMMSLTDRSAKLTGTGHPTGALQERTRELGPVVARYRHSTHTVDRWAVCRYCTYLGT